MARRLPHPTPGELAILRVLWSRGPSTVRDVHEALADSRDTGYTTTLKLMQIMAGKGLVTRDDSARTHVYAARQSESRTRGELVKDLIERAFGGSAAALVMQALASQPASAEELKEIRRAIAEHTKAKP